MTRGCRRAAIAVRRRHGLLGAALLLTAFRTSAQSADSPDPRTDMPEGFEGSVPANMLEPEHRQERPIGDPSWDSTLARGRTRTIDFETVEGTQMSVDVSPDERTVVFDLLGHIYGLPIEGGAAVCLTQDSGVAVNYHPRYSPDGKLIVFISDRTGQDNVWVMNADRIYVYTQSAK